MKRLEKGTQKTTPYMRLAASTETVMGVARKTYLPDGVVRLCNFSTYGGTEKDSNGVLVIEDTAQIVSWYEPDISGGDRIRILTTGAEYEIIGEPENIELRCQEMTYKVRRVKGGA